MTKETITPNISEISPKPENKKWYVRIGRKYGPFNFNIKGPMLASVPATDTRRPMILSRAYFKKIK